MLIFVAFVSTSIALVTTSVEPCVQESKFSQSEKLGEDQEVQLFGSILDASRLLYPEVNVEPIDFQKVELAFTSMPNKGLTGLRRVASLLDAWIKEQTGQERAKGICIYVSFQLYVFRQATLLFSGYPVDQTRFGIMSPISVVIRGPDKREDTNDRNPWTLTDNKLTLNPFHFTLQGRSNPDSTNSLFLDKFLRDIGKVSR